MNAVGRLAHHADLILGLGVALVLLAAIVGLAVADRWRRRQRPRRR